MDCTIHLDEITDMTRFISAQGMCYKPQKGGSTSVLRAPTLNQLPISLEFPLAKAIPVEDWAIAMDRLFYILYILNHLFH